MRQQHHHHQLDQKSVRGATSLTFAEKSDPSSDTMNKIPTNVKDRSWSLYQLLVWCQGNFHQNWDKKDVKTEISKTF